MLLIPQLFVSSLFGVHKEGNELSTARGNNNAAEERVSEQGTHHHQPPPLVVNTI